MSERFNVLMCKFYKFYICAVVGIIIEYILHSFIPLPYDRSIASFKAIFP